MVVATDGIWDAVTEEQVGRIVRSVRLLKCS